MDGSGETKREERSKIRFEEKMPGFGVVQNGRKLPRCQPDIQRHDNRAGLGHAEISFQQAVCIEAEECDWLACFHARFNQRGGESLATLAKLSVSEPLIS